MLLRGEGSACVCEDLRRIAASRDESLRALPFTRLPAQEGLPALLAAVGAGLQPGAPNLAREGALRTRSRGTLVPFLLGPTFTACCSSPIMGYGAPVAQLDRASAFSGSKFNLSRCDGCTYEIRAILGLLQSCSKIAKLSPASNTA
jgi:hypothetical protein